MFRLNSAPGRTCIADGKEFLFFSGYSYFGMNGVKEFTELVKAGMDKYGVLFPSSRISNTRLEIYDQFENALSRLTGMEDTVSFSSGFLAGRTITDVLSFSKNIFVAPHSHPSINIKEKQKTCANTFDEWAAEITDVINSSEENEFVLISDSVDIMRSEIHDFNFLKQIKEDKIITLLIDDSHGIGLTGNGSGISQHLQHVAGTGTEYIICYSLSKAFHIEGGAVSCSKKWADKLRQHPYYTGSTAISPAVVYAFINSKTLYAQQRDKLNENVSFLKANLPPFLHSANNTLPIFICKEKIQEEYFYNHGIIISSFPYPFPASEKINRVILNALHTKDDITKLLHL